VDDGTGVFKEKLLLSLRTCQYETSAGDLARRLVARRGTGGGHDTMPAPDSRWPAGRSVRLRFSCTHHRRFLQSVRLADAPEERLISQ